MRPFVPTAQRFLTALTRSAILLFIAASGPLAVAAPSANPSAGALPVTTAVPNLAKTLLFQGWMSYPDRYERMEQAVILSAGKTQVRIFTNNFTTGGTAVPFGVDATLTLTFDGKAVATVAVKAADVAATFAVDITGLAEGWYLASVTGLDGTWSVLDYGVYVLKGAVAQPQAWMPVTTASHELIFEGGGRYQQTWVPTKFEPVKIPYPSREFPALPTVPTRKDVVITSLAVPRPGDLYRPALTKEGVWTTANRENYFYFDFEQAKPILPMLDGPRGRGSIIAPVHLEVGSAAPNGVLRGNVYFIESWRVGKVTPDGTVVTLAGYRHKDMASYWNDPTSAELVGDWSSIPPERRGFAQPWGMAWDPRTVVINEAAPPIPSEGNEKPHVLGPALYISDTYRNRVVKLEYSATAHGVPPKVTEFVTGLNQPWDVIAVGTQLYVSDRMNNAIKVFDIDTAALVKTIPVVQPEGMALLDGWLYYASVKSKSIRKINLATGEDVLISDPTVAGSSMGYYINNNSRYMKIAVSDGSFGPRGMIAYTTWSNSYYGYPNLIDGTTGKMIDWIVVKPGETVKGVKPLGLSSYSTAVGIGYGRMLFGTAEEGLHVVSKALDSDPVVDAATYKTGKDQWQARGYGLTHGPGGYGFYGLPLPWGETPEIDYFLRANFHGAGLPGSGTNPSVGTSSSSLAFGNVTVGQTSAAQTITVSNVGTADATNMSYPAAPAKYTRGGTCGSATLAMGANCTITFTYSPTSAMADNATYTFAGGGSTIGISMSGTGTSAASANLSAAPAQVAFGNVTVGQTSGAKTVTVSNTGGAAAAGVALANSNAAKFALASNTCGTSIAAGASCSVNVTYVPSAAATDNATLTITYTGGTPVVVALSGTGTAAPTANLGASPATLSFGSVNVGSTSATQSITITNNGAAPAGSITRSSANATEFVTSGTCTTVTSIAVNDTCTLAVSYKPGVAGASTGSYSLTSGSVGVTVSFSGTGVAGTPNLLASPNSASFGSIQVGQTSGTQLITVTNSGSGQASGVAFSNPKPTVFLVTGNTCGNTLNAGATCSFNLAYKPSVAGAESDTLTINFAGGSAAVAMSGTGIGAPTAPAVLSATPTSLSFGSVAVGSTSAARTVIISNAGGAVASNVSFVSGNAAKFALAATTCGTSIAAGASCSVSVTYSPSATATESANLTVTYTGGTPIVVAMSGTGTATPVASLGASLASISFGSVTVGSTAAVRTVTVTNSGGAQATAVSVVSGSAARFPVSANTCGATLGAGASCTFGIAYAPSAAGADSASVTVSYAGGANVVVAVSGSGTSAASANLTAAPPLVAFGNATVGQTSGATAVTVTNTGGAAATGVSFVNSNAPSFPITTNTCGTSVGAGATCTFTTAFSPAAVGPDSATVTLTYAGGGALTVSLSGVGATGTPQPGAGQLSFVTLVTMPDTAVGATSAARTVTIFNTGNAAVSVTGVASSSGEFAVGSNGCGNVAVGGACSFAVTFSPNAVGARSGLITVASDVSGSPRTLAVNGNGVASSGYTPPTATNAVAVEYYHEAFDHYFMTALQDEITKLDNGTFVGWARTGKQFNVNVVAAAGREPVCRFFSTAFGIKSSHFYTSDVAECMVVQSNLNWQFEGGVFYATTPAFDGTCPGGTIPVYRVYNNGQGGAPNHRYTTDLAVRAMMLQLGWIPEGYGSIGVIMCAPM